MLVTTGTGTFSLSETYAMFSINTFSMHSLTSTIEMSVIRGLTIMFFICDIFLSGSARRRRFSTRSFLGHLSLFLGFLLLAQGLLVGHVERVNAFGSLACLF